MTVTYTGEVASCKGFGCFLKLLFRWKGSIYKLVWPDLCLFLAIFFSLSLLYRYGLDPDQQIVFEQIVRYCRQYGNLIPISFILGFYVSIVVGRWWDQYKTIPWTDSIATFVSASIQGQDEKGRVIRRTIMRYCVLSMTMCFSMISPKIKRRFPTLEHLVEAGLLLENEKEIIEDINRCVSYNTSWIPIVWAASIVTRARKEGKIRDDSSVKTILEELNKFRSQCGLLISYDWISVPLVYTQVCTLAVYSYFAASMMGSQWLKNHTSNKEKDEIDLIFPIFTTLQFFFYMGWLKVAETLINPFGMDDDDFELNWLIDRAHKVSYLIVDEMWNNHPDLIKDQYWDEVYVPDLPYTVAAEEFRDDEPVSSTANIKVSEDEQEIVSPPSVKLDEMSLSGAVGRRVSLTPSKRGSFIRRERTASVRSNASQSTLNESVSGKLSRAASITSVFKRMFSREGRDRDNLHSPTTADGRPPEFYVGSTTNMPRKVMDEVIEELDENMTTIISTKKEQKPTVHEIFGTGPPIPASALTKEDIPAAKSAFLSSSAPAPGPSFPSTFQNLITNPIESASSVPDTRINMSESEASSPPTPSSVGSPGFPILDSNLTKTESKSGSIPNIQNPLQLQKPTRRNLDLKLKIPKAFAESLTPSPDSATVLPITSTPSTSNSQAELKTGGDKEKEGGSISEDVTASLSSSSSTTTDEDVDMDLDETMHDLHRRKPSKASKISKRIAKTLGLGKDKEKKESERREQHLLLSRSSTSLKGEITSSSDNKSEKS